MHGRGMVLMQDRSRSLPPPAAEHSGYQENMLLILIALGWIFPFYSHHEFLPFLVVLSAVAVYYDAQNIHAGGQV